MHRPSRPITARALSRYAARAAQTRKLSQTSCKKRMCREAVRELGGAELDALVDWLAQVYLLINVPFENLVRTRRCFPTESVRFLS